MSKNAKRTQEERLAGRVPADQLHEFYHYTHAPHAYTDKKGQTHVANVLKWTHCFVVDANGRYAAGNALCSVLDNPDKAEGRRVAYRRAVRGYYNQQNVLGHTPEGSTMYKTMVGMPLSALQKKFVDMATKQLTQQAAGGSM